MFTGLLAIGLLIVEDMHVEFRVVEGRFMSPAVRGGGAVGPGVLVTAEGGLTHTTSNTTVDATFHSVAAARPGPSAHSVTHGTHTTGQILSHH